MADLATRSEGLRSETLLTKPIDGPKLHGRQSIALLN